MGDFTAEDGGGVAVTHDDHDRIVTGESADHHAHIHGVNGRCGSAGQTGQRVDHHDILCVIIAGHALAENGIEAVGEGRGNFLRSGGITVGAKRGQLFDDP